MLIRSAVLAILLLFPAVSSAATIYLDPDTGTYGPGDTFILNVRLNNGDECINAAHVEIDYPEDALRAADFGKGGSIFSLWVEEPRLDIERGRVTFSGGIPGGYCGRIQGDPGLSNILGKVVFTVTDARAKNAAIAVIPASQLYLNDGFGTALTPEGQGAQIALVDTPQTDGNAWVSEVQSDTIPPEPFDVVVESTRDVFNGHYYLVFSTIDKQSGIDHFELFERGGWRPVESPHELRNSSILQNLQLKAVDKAGNERIGNFSPDSVPPRQYSLGDFTALFAIAGILLLALAAKLILDRRSKPPESGEAPLP